MIHQEKRAKLYRLKNLIRYNTRTRLTNESVAEHSFYVALFALMICDKYRVSSEVALNALIKALLHDLPEIETNDITHDAKQRLGLQSIIAKYEKEYYEREFPSFAHLMNLDDNSVSSAIVNLADVESVRQYVLNEICLGNTSKDISEIQEESMTRLVNLEDKLRNKINE